MKKSYPLKNYIIFSFFLFMIFVLTGYLFADLNYELANKYLEKIIEEFRHLIHPDPFKQFLVIFFHNAVASFLMIITFFFFGLSALVSLFSNGIILGIIMNIFYEKIGLLAVAVLLVPHGIIELPAFFISAAVSLRLGIQWAKSISPHHSFKGEFPSAMKTFLKIILPMFLVAAFIESFITPLIFKILK
ncbi:MAG: stage II sporulation protein M [Patescibacteria group bacterium]|nr:stage II sporulation protein M [Patescibacteria group bacterium]